VREPPLQLRSILIWLDQGSLWALVFLVLLPLAMTMALIWKIKETILDGIYGSES
jgi:hypothetical protein